MGMLVYFLIAMLFGGGFGLLALIVHEDNDRCHYYHGVWNRGGLAEGLRGSGCRHGSEVCGERRCDMVNNSMAAK